jgi:hypothetical protein
VSAITFRDKVRSLIQLGPVYNEDVVVLWIASFKPGAIDE